MLIDRFVDALIRWPVAVLRFSVDGASRETYERIRVGGRFDRLLSNLKVVRRAISENGLPTLLQMNPTLSRDNLDEVPLFYDVYGPYIDEDQIDFRVVTSLAAGSRDYYNRVKLIEADEWKVPCAQLWEMLYVGYDGRVSACCRDYHGELIVGDVTRQSLSEIWHGPMMSSLRDAHGRRDKAALPRLCRGCYGPGARRATLLSCMVSAMRRTLPDVGRREFAERLEAFLTRLNAPNASPHSGASSSMAMA
jgi:radical SAM protein with 4Fe4S-binding SPASM domain